MSQSLQSVDELQNWISNCAMTNRPILLMFKASWCSKCSKIEPIYDSLDTPNLLRIKIDVAQYPEITDAYQVKNVPTFVGIRNHIIKSEYSGSSVKGLQDSIKNI